MRKPHGSGPPSDAPQQREEARIKVVYEDEFLCVLIKGAGLLSQSAKAGDDSLVSLLQKSWAQDFVGLVHRLDRNVSGLMVLAKSERIAKKLSQDLVHGKIERVYHGVFAGLLREAQVWRDFILKDEARNKSRVFLDGSAAPPVAQEAVLAFSPRLWGEHSFEGHHLAVTLGEIRLETGRSHQIRAQSRAHGFPLLGDPKYGVPRGLERPLLHSTMLKLIHPVTLDAMQFQDFLPWDKLFGIEWHQT